MTSQPAAEGQEWPLVIEWYANRPCVMEQRTERKRIIASCSTESDAKRIFTALNTQAQAEGWRKALENLTTAASKVDDEVAEFGKVVSSEIYGWFEQAILDAKAALDAPRTEE